MGHGLHKSLKIGSASVGKSLLAQPLSEKWELDFPKLRSSYFLYTLLLLLVAYVARTPSEHALSSTQIRETACGVETSNLQSDGLK